MRRPINLSFAIALLGLSGLGQESSGRFDALKQALLLSDAQLEQLQKNPWPPPAQPLRENVPSRALSAGAPDGSFFGGSGPTCMPDQLARSLCGAFAAYIDAQRQILNDGQRTKLDAIAKVFDDGTVAALAIRIGLVTKRQWGGAICLYPMSSYGFQKDYPDRLALTPTQIELFELMEQGAKPLWAWATEYEEQAGLSASLTDTAVASSTDAKRMFENLRAQIISVLDAGQSGVLAKFEADLRLANQAAELHLVPGPLRGDPLCN